MNRSRVTWRLVVALTVVSLVAVLLVGCSNEYIVCVVRRRLSIFFEIIFAVGIGFAGSGAGGDGGGGDGGGGLVFAVF